MGSRSGGVAVAESDRREPAATPPDLEPVPGMGDREGWLSRDRKRG